MAEVTIQSAVLKKLLKKLSAINSVSTVLDCTIVSTSDGDCGIAVKTELEFPKATVNSKLLSSIGSKLSAGEVTLSKSVDGPLGIQSGKFRAEIPTNAEAPILAPASSLSGQKIPIKVLTDLLTFTSSITTEGVTFDHTGAIQLSQFYQYMEAAATDNLRIAVATAKTDLEPGLKILIPSKIVKAIKDLEGEFVEISETDSTIVFESAGATIWTKKLTKRFPDIQKVFPKTYALEVEIETETLLESLHRLSPLVDENLKIILDFNGDVLTLATAGANGKAEDKIPVNSLIPDALNEPLPIRLAVNLKFLQQDLTNFKGHDKLLFKANEGAKPFLIQSGWRQVLTAGMKL